MLAKRHQLLGPAALGRVDPRRGARPSAPTAARRCARGRRTRDGSRSRARTRAAPADAGSSPTAPTRSAAASSPARRGRSVNNSIVWRRCGSASAASVRSSATALRRSRPVLRDDGHADRGLGIGSSHVADVLGERPHVTLEIDRAIRAIAVELIFGLGHDDRTRGAGSFAVLLDAARATRRARSGCWRRTRSRGCAPMLPTRRRP